MQNTKKDIIITAGFFMILLIIFFINIFSKDNLLSISERRKLAKFPAIDSSEILSGNFMDKFEQYATDQFIGRDAFRQIKNFFSVNILNKKDNNKLFEKNGAIYKTEYPLNHNTVKKSLNKINLVYDKYLQNMNVYYAVIPEKNYYLKNDDHLKIDYNELISLINSDLSRLTYIDIWDSLCLSDFYNTDLHWKQENLHKTVECLQIGMNLETNLNTSYTTNNMGDFYGAYYGQLGKNVSPDILYTLSNTTLDNCITYNYETNKSDKIYTTENISFDKYDIFLSGPTPLISIENPNCNNGKELLLFRDSFGSSLAPLLVENYSKITLIDLRYISMDLLPNYIEFNNQDVLFLYSALILNQGF